MRVWISGEIQSEIAEAYRVQRRKIEEQLNSLLETQQLGSAVEKWALIGILRPDGDDSYPEVQRYSKRAKVVEFRLKVSLSAFRSADPRAQERLLLDCLTRSIDLSEQMDLGDFDRAAWRAVVESIH